MLAGLTARSAAKNRAGLPLLSQIPVIGALFGSHGARQEEVQNLVFIVPSIVDIVGLGARNQIREALKAYDQYAGDLRETSLASPALSLKEEP